MKLTKVEPRETKTFTVFRYDQKCVEQNFKFTSSENTYATGVYTSIYNKYSTKFFKKTTSLIPFIKIVYLLLLDEVSDSNYSGIVKKANYYIFL